MGRYFRVGAEDRPSQIGRIISGAALLSPFASHKVRQLPLMIDSAIYHSQTSAPYGVQRGSAHNFSPRARSSRPASHIDPRRGRTTTLGAASHQTRASRGRERSALIWSPPCCRDEKRMRCPCRSVDAGGPCSPSWFPPGVVFGVLACVWRALSGVIPALPPFAATAVWRRFGMKARSARAPVIPAGWTGLLSAGAVRTVCSRRHAQRSSLPRSAAEPEICATADPAGCRPRPTGCANTRARPAGTTCAERPDEHGSAAYDSDGTSSIARSGYGALPHAMAILPPTSSWSCSIPSWLLASRCWWR